MQIKDYDEAMEIIQLLKDGCAFDLYPELEPYCQYTEQTHDLSYLQTVIDNWPWMINFAKQKKAAIDGWIVGDPFYPPPYKDDELDAIGGTYSLGLVNSENSETGLDPIDLTRGLFICGEPGGGKTYAALSLIDQMLKVPLQKRGFNIIIFQIVKRDADFLIRSYPNLRIIEYDDLRYNMWRTEKWDRQKTRLKSSLSIFSSVNWLGPLTQPILKVASNICLKYGNEPTFSKINRMILPAVKHLELGSYEVKNHADKVRQRLSEFIDTEEIFDGDCHYPIDEFWTEEDIILNLMDEPSSYIYRTFLSDLLVTMQRYYEQKRTENRLNTLIVIDECRSVFPYKSPYSEDDTDGFLERFITTARSSGIGRITITQEPHNVSNWLPDNSAFFWTFPIAGRAIDHLKNFMNLSDEQISHIAKLEKHGEGIFRDRRFDRPYIIEVPPYLNDKPIDMNYAKALMQPYIDNLQARFTAKQKLVRKKAEIYTDAQLNYYRSKIWTHTRAVLEKLHSDPFLNKTKLMALIDGGRKKFDMSIEYLTKRRFIKAIECKMSKTRPATFYALTVDGFRLLEIPEEKRKHGARMFKHDYYCMRVYEYLAKKNLSPIQEFLPGNLKSLGAHGRIDVYCESRNGKRYANEITLSFSNLINNVKKCDLAGMDAITIICEDQAGIDRAKAMIEDAHIRTNPELKFKKIGEYL